MHTSDILEKLDKDEQQLPKWQQQLVNQIYFALEKNYILFHQKSDELQNALTDAFKQRFSNLTSMAKIIELYEMKLKASGWYENPSIHITQFPLEGSDESSRVNYLEEQIKKLGINNGIIINGQGENRTIYLVTNGHVSKDNMFKGMSLTTINAKNISEREYGILQNNSPLFETLLAEAIKRIAYTEFAELRMNHLLEDVIGDPHLSFSYNRDLLSENREHIQATGDFPELSSPDASKDNFGFYQEPINTKESVPDNMGYVRLSRIYNPDSDPRIKQRCFSVMETMIDKDAVIIDLRHTGGGTPEGVQYFLSFFFQKPTHLNTVFTRKNNSLSEKEFKTFSLSELNPNSDSEKTVDLSDINVYILTSENTFSAAEELAYDMQQQGRAMIIGDTTKGGAHPCIMKPLLTPNTSNLNENFCMIVPNATSVNPISKTNWEDKVRDSGEEPGVIPDRFLDKNEPAFEIIEEIQNTQSCEKTPTPFSMEFNPKK